MAAKFWENKTIRESLINQMKETLDIAESAREQVPLRSLFQRRMSRAHDLFDKFGPFQTAVVAYVAAQPDGELNKE